MSESRRFDNETLTAHAGFADLLRWMATRKPGPWRKWTTVPPAPSPPPALARGDAGHVRQPRHGASPDGRREHPDRSDLVGTLQPRLVRRAERAVPPGLRLEQLPPIDVILVSHNHYDHLDLPTLRRLAAEHGPRILVPTGNRPLLERAGVGGAEELAWWKSVVVADGVRIAAVPARHFSGRGFFDRNRSLWAGFVISGPAGSAYFAGDTGFGPHFQEIRALRFAARGISADRGVPAGVVHVASPHVPRRGASRASHPRRGNERRGPFRNVPPRRRRAGRAAGADRGPAARRGRAPAALLDLGVRRGTRRPPRGTRARLSG